jgi:hypothetical protein
MLFFQAQLFRMCNSRIVISVHGTKQAGQGRFKLQHWMKKCQKKLYSIISYRWYYQQANILHQNAGVVRYANQSIELFIAPSSVLMGPFPC